MIKADTNTICPAPFCHQTTKTDGKIKACCRSRTAVGNITKASLHDNFNNETIKQLRLDLINGVKNKICDICWEYEAGGVRSLRQKYLASPDRRFDRWMQASLNTMLPDGTLQAKPKWIEFKISNLCNFKCRMCHPLDSTKWFNDYPSIKQYHSDGMSGAISKLNLEEKPLTNSFNEDFFKSLPESLSEVEEVWFAGGEPLYDDSHYRILDSILDRAHDITLSYSTNLSMLSNKKYNVLDYWKKFKRVRINVSLDGSPKLNEYIRSGAVSNEIEENISILKDYPNIRITGKTTVQALNIFDMPNVFEWFRKIDFYNTDIHYVTYPDFLDCRIWSGTARKEIINTLSKYNDTLVHDLSNIKHNIEDIIRFFQSQELHTQERWDKFVNYNKTLDKLRNETYKDFDFLKRHME